MAKDLSQHPHARTDVPSAPEPAGARGEGAGESPLLALSIHRQGLGLALARGVSLGPVHVADAYAALPGLQFPLDVSGGVERFRHRRGLLDRLQLHLVREDLEAFASRRLAGVLSTQAPHVSLAFSGGEFRVLVSAPVSVESEQPSARLAFRGLTWTDDSSLCVAIQSARGTGLVSPAMALALRAMGAVFGASASRAGSVFTVSGAVGSIVRAIFPQAGARAPDCDGVMATRCLGHDDLWTVVFSREVAATGSGRDRTPAQDATAEVVLAKEHAALLRHADDALFDGNNDTARAHLLAALDKSPRSFPALERLAAIDAHAGEERAHAVVATLADLRTDVFLGSLRAEVLLSLGQESQAVAAAEADAESETHGPLAADMLAFAAAHTRDGSTALALLDRAIALSPGSPHLRWQRLRARLRLGHAGYAADAEHLEALATNRQTRFAILLRLGSAFLGNQKLKEAARCYERALRLAPSTPDTLLGLARTYASMGKHDQAGVLAQRAISACEKRGESASRAELFLAELLGEHLLDPSGAIARLVGVADGPEFPRAQLLEGRYRSQLHDLAGASLAFSRMREHMARGILREEFFPWLMEAARFEHSRRGDVDLSRTHLELALRIAPRDSVLRAELAALLAKATPEQAPAVPVSEPVAHVPATPAKVEEPWNPDAAEQRVEVLKRQLEGSPDDDAIVDELSDLLTKLGRGMELLAVLSARLEDAAPERRKELLPKQRAVLERLEREATEKGHASEAELYRMAREALPT
ncbi:MAG: tetratricopeptide repeat protein [Polyangiaceae bacterium]